MISELPILTKQKFITIDSSNKQAATEASKKLREKEVYCNLQHKRKKT